MATDVPIQCACGALRGRVRDVSPEAGSRVVCYCDDCQAFAWFLEGADTILDGWGGTDVFQLSQGQIEITEGREHLACMRLTPRGLLRWYTSCCRTPIGNTLATRQLPFIGLIHSCTDDDAPGARRDAAFGPIRAGVYGRFAKGDRSRLDAHDRGPISLLLRALGQTLGARLRGEHARSPFFHPQTAKPVATPRVLTPEELTAVETVRDRAV